MLSITHIKLCFNILSYLNICKVVCLFSFVTNEHLFLKNPLYVFLLVFITFSGTFQVPNKRHKNIHICRLMQLHMNHRKCSISRKNSHFCLVFLLIHTLTWLCVAISVSNFFTLFSDDWPVNSSGCPSVESCLASFHKSFTTLIIIPFQNSLDKIKVCEP